ncbi:hypothetical protein [Rhodopila sp.]|uniref:hypothetical protein n=1 Tax=Rhodopila sp. TaxID=2480087 RepID=UPI003D136776
MGIAAGAGTEQYHPFNLAAVDLVQGLAEAKHNRVDFDNLGHYALYWTCKLEA